MKLTVVAATQIVGVPESIQDTKVGRDMDENYEWSEADIDLLHEFAGRACYKSFNRPNPATEKNEDYLGHIIDSAHLSVLEHGQVSIYVEDVSRSLLLELERHGRNSHLSFSVESQRFVSTSKWHREPVIPPMFKEFQRNNIDAGVIAESQLRAHYAESLTLYDQTYNDLRDAGVPLKQAREAARSFLPNATPVDFLVTADIRGWREVIEKRDAPGADAEIREFAQQVDELLQEYAPNSMQVVDE